LFLFLLVEPAGAGLKAKSPPAGRLLLSCATKQSKPSLNGGHLDLLCIFLAIHSGAKVVMKPRFAKF
jgi:hypothetical protein